MSEEEQKYFKGLIGFTFDSDDIRYIEKIVDKKDKEIERLNNELEKQNIDYGLEIEELKDAIDYQNCYIEGQNEEIERQQERQLEINEHIFNIIEAVR